MTTNSKTVIEAYADGSATVGDSPGGWAFRIVANGKPIFETSGYAEKATNNDMELEAMLQSLEYLKAKYDEAGRDPKLEEIYVVSDSQIALGWASGKYRVKQKEKVEKVKRLQELVILMGVIPKWVKGHGTNEHNIRCDKLAGDARKKKILEKSAISVIGTKKRGVMAFWYKGILKLICLETNTVEDYNKEAHGQRGSRMELQTENK
jgi:ribonuclease HI